MFINAAPTDGKHILAIFLLACPDAQRTKNAAVMINQDIFMRGVHFAGGIKMREMVVEHI